MCPWLWGGNLSWGQDSLFENYLPLAVGNSWTYKHIYWNKIEEEGEVLTPPGAFGFEGEFTLAITHTEEIDGKTYYVFSDVNPEWPPVPYFFLAGKKVRFDSQGRLMERRDDTEKSLYHFRPNTDALFSDAQYVIPSTKGDTLAVSQLVPFSERVLSTHFAFSGRTGRGAEFKEAEFVNFFGLWICVIRIMAGDEPLRNNVLVVQSAIIDGQFKLSSDAAAGPTAISGKTWGVIKQIISN